MFSLYFLLSSFEHKYPQTTQNIELDNIFIEEKLLLWLTFNLGQCSPAFEQPGPEVLHNFLPPQKYQIKLMLITSTNYAKDCEQKLLSLLS